ncbi:thioredoxin [Anaerosacchariphilus polymeriproducens]|uniref:Thioredoxin n=1 Tax=Anaerosacchariphilus polymeriproducens TaxID=1812858 RepID=A0A371B0D2_9FIRM|nr:thioredoxin [Anaerosacchariphilus polymeriproducens]RDU25243.1 thioredoxin [Anaerosacchariphilus polymeriproducens]
MGIIKVSSTNYMEQVEKNSKLVLLDFYADWCGPCQMVAPVLEEVAREKAEKVQIGKVDIDVDRQLASKFKVMSIPTLVLLKNGEVVQTLIGAQSKQTILEMIDNQ